MQYRPWWRAGGRVKYPRLILPLWDHSGMTMVMDTQTQSQTGWTIKKLLEWTTAYLQNAAVDQPRLCAEILLAHVLQWARIELYVKFEYCPQPDELAEFRELVRRCGKHEPCAYLTGKSFFYSLELEVTPSVLIPRPETEVLVSEAINTLRRQSVRPVQDVLDVGTGSGCIAVAIAENVIETEILATDRSAAAVEVARRNIEKYNLQARVSVLQSDIFEQVARADKGVFDLIVSNPPYISNEEFSRLESNVRDYEPEEALRGGEDGLEFYRRIISQGQSYLAEDGSLMLEVAYNQAERVVEIMEEYGYLKDIQTIKDSLGHQRVVSGINK
ncbi:MAG: peptide chain release factor N(5)-glutamine methyltransferase [Sedimentisphaerales bacterium]|nr:peptide chain release factor N(5)-glutamine methyltransferase [Sedimentisphaerales bacterium]